MRTFEKNLDRIHRKVAKQLVTNEQQPPVAIEKEDLETYLGQPVFREEVVKKVTRPGMAVGLAWTSMGGDTLLIEAVENPGKENFKLTGQMGEVMQESANIAYTFIRSIASGFGVDKAFFENNIIHLHIPAGATPKDGPSAGITMASALLSLACKKKIRANVAMTGELSLVGKVLPIGGLKEKTIAARRNRIKHIIIPEQNLKDLEEIPDYIKKGIEFHPVQTMEQVTELIF